MSDHQEQTTTTDVTPANIHAEGASSTFTSTTASDDGLKIRILRNRRNQSEERRTVVPPTTSPVINLVDDDEGESKRKPARPRRISRPQPRVILHQLPSSITPSSLTLIPTTTTDKISEQRKRKISTTDEEEKGPLNLSVKRSRPLASSLLPVPPPPPPTSSSHISFQSQSSNIPILSHLLRASSPSPLSVITQSLSLATRSMWHYRTPLCSPSPSISIRPNQQTFSPFIPTPDPLQALTARFSSPPPQNMSFPPTTVTNTVPSSSFTRQLVDQPLPRTTATATSASINVPVPPSQVSNYLPLYKLSTMYQLKRAGLAQAWNATGQNVLENTYLFTQEQAMQMQNLLPLDRQKEFLALMKLRAIGTQFQECQRCLSAIFPSDGINFVRDNRTKARLNIIINLLTHRLSDIKNIASGLDSIMDLP